MCVKDERRGGEGEGRGGEEGEGEESTFGYSLCIFWMEENEISEE
jgi:hypothetical protein